jgi:hypothetical protein
VSKTVGAVATVSSNTFFTTICAVVFSCFVSSRRRRGTMMMMLYMLSQSQHISEAFLLSLLFSSAKFYPYDRNGSNACENVAGPRCARNMDASHNA